MRTPAEILKGHTDQEVASALVEVLGDCQWEAVALAHGFLEMDSGADDTVAARSAFKRGVSTLSESRRLIAKSKEVGFIGILKPREKIGSAENPVTKLFPATVTEQRFLELADRLCASRPTLEYIDQRETGHTLTDIILRENNLQLPINVKVASTRFEKAKDLVGLEPDDCIPIPAYKAYGALETVPNLLYVIAVDYTLIATVTNVLDDLLSEQESLVWAVINAYAGARLRRAEDAFVSAVVREHWRQFRATVHNAQFNAISARKAIKILQTMPKRTPGLGLRAWGTGASAEVNVHISVSNDAKPWDYVLEKITTGGISTIISAINRKKRELVFDPEI